jgi:hypothetical protein
LPKADKQKSTRGVLLSPVRAHLLPAPTPMHDLEPYHKWRHLYIASEDEHSPFYRRRYSEFSYTDKIYNYYIHPQWDHIGSETLYTKVLFVDYDAGYSIIEFIGEWNDAVHNDIMLLKRNLLEAMLRKGITRFIFICDNLLNFHSGDTDYYEELAEDLREDYPAGWAIWINTRQHVYEEMEDGRLDHYIHFGEQYNDLNWRNMQPNLFYALVEDLFDGRMKRLD